MNARLAPCTDPAIEILLRQRPLPDPYRSDLQYALVVEDPMPVAFVTFLYVPPYAIFYQCVITRRRTAAIYEAFQDCLAQHGVLAIATRVDDHWPWARRLRKTLQRIGLTPTYWETPQRVWWEKSLRPVAE